MITKNRIIAVLSVVILVLVYLLNDREEVVNEVVKTVVKYDTITSIIDNTKPTKIEKVFIDVVKYDTITYQKTFKVIDTVYKKQKVNRYVYKDTLKNGMLESTIIADNIYGRDIKLKTFNKETTTEIKKTIVKSNLFFGTSAILSNDKSIENISLDAYYVRKDKWLLKGGIGYSLESNQPNASLGFALKF